MISNTNDNQNGFTAVELLITLLIASMFLFSGYQLYTQVTRDGADANELASVSNAAYKVMQEKAVEQVAAQAQGCGATNSTQTTVGNYIYDAQTTCPLGTSNPKKLFKISVKAYERPPGGAPGLGPFVLEHTTYAN